MSSRRTGVYRLLLCYNELIYNILKTYPALRIDEVNMTHLRAFLFIVLTVFIACSPAAFSQAQQAAQTSKPEAEEDAPPLPPPNPMLKGVNYIRVQSVFNGSPYFKGYRHPTETDIKEYHLLQTETILKDMGAGLKKEDIRSIYTFLEDQLKKGSVRSVDLHPIDEKEPTVVPVLTLDIDLTVNTEQIRVVLVTLSVSRWMSDWSGTESLQVPAIIWTERNLFTVSKSAATLVQEINSATNTLTQKLLSDISRANLPEPEEQQ